MSAPRRAVPSPRCTGRVKGEYMRLGLSAAMLVSLACPSAWAQTGHLPLDQIAAAIAEAAKSRTLPVVTTGSDTVNQFVVAVRGPYGRVMSFAADKKLKYQTITAYEVPPDLTGPYLEVIATPGKPAAGDGTSTPAATHIAIRKKGDKGRVEPGKVEPLRVQWDSPSGGKVQGQGLRARFDLSTIPPSGELEVIVATRDFERVYTLEAEDRPRLK